MASQELLSKAVNNPTFRLAVQNAFNHIIITDLDGKIFFANKAAEKMTGYSSTEIIGKNPNLWGNRMDKTFYEGMWKIIKDERRQFEGIITNRKKNGELYKVRVIITPIIDVGDELIGYIGTEENVKEAQEEDVNQALNEMQSSLNTLNDKLDILLDKLGEKVTQEDRIQFKEIKETNDKLLALVRSAMYEN